MLRKLLFSSLLTLGSLTAAADWTDDVSKALCLYDNENAFVQKVRFSAIMQYQMAVVQPNGSNGLHFRQGAGAFVEEMRRTWADLCLDFASGTQLFTRVRLGGFPSRMSYEDGTARRNYNYFGLNYLILKQDIPAVKGLSLSVGKSQPLIGTENYLGSAEIKCVERSVANIQYDFDASWGIELNYAPNADNSVFFQLFANDAAHYMKANEHADHYRDGRGFKGEFGWEDKCFAVVGGTHRFGVTESGFHQLSAQYAHDFNNAYHGRRQPGANCFGLGVKDVLVLGYDYQQDKLALMSNLYFNFERMDAQGSNSTGLVLRPVYSLTPHVDLVARYTTMMGDGACRLAGDPYICSQTTADAYVDSLHAFYLGANFYASAKNPNAAKIMFGAEYLTARKNGSDCYNGWTYSVSFRTCF